MSLADRLDDAISIFAPGWAAQRRVARLALESADRIAASDRLAWHRDAFPSRLERGVTHLGSSGDYELEVGQERRKLVDRARQAEKYQLLAGAMLDRSTEAVIGENGFRVQAKTADPKYNDAAEALWKDWAENDADSRGILTFPEILAMLYRSQLRDGDVGCVLLEDGSLRIVESDEISSPEGYTRPDMVDGVELDDRGRPVAYNVYTPDLKAIQSDRRLAFKRTRVPADEFIFFARRLRASQTRGTTAFQGIFWHLEQFDGLVQAVTVSARMAASFGLVIRRQGGPGSLANLPNTTDATGATKKKLSIEPGAVVTLNPGEDITQIAPAHPSANLEAHGRLLVRICATRFGLSLEIVLGDFSLANYSNTRTGLIQLAKKIRGEQTRVARIASKIYRWKVLNWIEEGKLPVRDDALRHLWTTPGTPWIDPVAEFQASLGALDAGLETKTNILARLGYDLDEVRETRKREIEEDKAAGLPDVRSNLTRDPGTPAQKDGEAPKGQDKPPS